MTDKLKKVLTEEEEKRLKENGVDILSDDEMELVSGGVYGSMTRMRSAQSFKNLEDSPVYFKTSTR